MHRAVLESDMQTSPSPKVAKKNVSEKMRNVLKRSQKNYAFFLIYSFNNIFILSWLEKSIQRHSGPGKEPPTGGVEDKAPHQSGGLGGRIPRNTIFFCKILEQKKCLL